MSYNTIAKKVQSIQQLKEKAISKNTIWEKQRLWKKREEPGIRTTKYENSKTQRPNYNTSENHRTEENNKKTQRKEKDVLKKTAKKQRKSIKKTKKIKRQKHKTSN